jgi:nucleoside-diphosphate-sugar epimerase
VTTVLVTGGAGYLGSTLAHDLVRAGYGVRVLDSLVYGGQALLPLLGAQHFALLTGDIRDAEAVRRAVRGVDAVVHLAAIVGDPACAREPALATAVNRDGTALLIAAAREHGVERFVFASTCSNYGRMVDTSVLATEEHELRPVSHYARTKVDVERILLDSPERPPVPTVLRFATLYGLSGRMRFDLTVNEFVRELLLHRRLTVYGEQFWRPYVHVRDAARAIAAVLAAAPERVGGQVFNVGDTRENYRKLDLVRMIRERVGGGDVEFVARAEDPRDYRVAFERIRDRLGYAITRRVEDGIDEIASALESGALDARDGAAARNA